MNQKLLNNFRLRVWMLVALMCAAFTETAWGDVVSGTTYSTLATSSLPAGWSGEDGGGTSYIKLTASTHYIQTSNFAQNGFTSITVKARKFGGPTDDQALITVSWYDASTSAETVLGTVSPTNTTLTDYTISSPTSPASNTMGYIKIQCKGAGNGKGSGVSEVTITYIAAGGSGEATTTTIDASGITNTDVYIGTAAGSLSATVTAGGNAIGGATVTWSGNNNNVATIDGSTGVVTLVGKGSVTFTATYAGVAETYHPSSATYKMTVTSSAPHDPSYEKVTSDQTDWSGKYIFTGKNGNNNYALTGVSDNLGTADLVTVTDNAITSTSTTDSYKVTVATIGNTGRYSLYMDGVGYLYYSGSENKLYANNTLGDEGKWSFSYSNGVVTISNVSTSARILQFNYNNGSPRFACYTSSQVKLTLFKYDDVTPSIAASDVNIAYDATEGSFNYTINNPVEGGAVSVDTVSGGAWLTSATESNGTVSFTCTANETNAARQARVEITYNYNNTETVTKQVLITQAAVPTTYTITFDAGDGTFVGNEDFPSTTNTVVAGTYTLPSATPPEGYYFNGWLPYLNASPKTGEYKVFGSVNFTAKYTSVTAPACSIDLDRYDFGKVALNTSATKTFTVTTANLTGELRLHNGGSPEVDFTISPTTIPQGATSTEVTITFTPTSIRPYSFFLKATGGGVYAHDLTEIRGEGAQSYTVTFNPGNGTCATASMACFENEEMDLPVATPSADCQVDGWTFAGWATDSIATASTASLVPSRYAPTQDITLYAVYQLAGAGATTTFNFYDIAIANDWAIETVQPTVEISPITLNAMGGGYNGTYFHNNDTWRMYTGGSLYITSIGGPITSVTSNPNTTFTITNGSASQSFTDKTEFKSITVNYTTATFATAPEYITVATNPVNVSAAAEVGTIGISYSNLTISQASDFHIQYCDAEGNELSAGSEPDWVTVSVAAQDPQIGEGYVVSYNIGENTSSKARSAYFKVYALDKFANTIYSDLITITQDRPVEMLTYTLVPAITNIPNITYGKHYIIVNQENGKAMGGQNTNNRAAVDVTINDATVTFASNVGVAEFIIYGPDEYGLYTIYDEENNGYLYAAGGNNDNYLKIKENVDGGSLGHWNISIDADTKGFIIEDSGNPNSTFIQFNNNNIFSCYANTSMGPVHLYEKVGEATLTESVTVTSVGYATFASDYALDFTDTGIEAYIAKADGTTGVTFTPVNKIPIGTGVLLHKEGGATVDVPVLAGAADNVTDNVFFRGYDDTIESVETSSSHFYHNYILNNGASGLGFYRANGKMVAKNRAYIRIQNDESTNVKGFIALPGFGDETAVEAVKAEAVDGVIFNLAGQRVNSTQKGIFIVNGKKVVVK